MACAPVTSAGVARVEIATSKKALTSGSITAVSARIVAISAPLNAVESAKIASLISFTALVANSAAPIASVAIRAAVRKAAISALVTLKGPEAVNDIRPCLDDQDLWVRYHCITCIGEMGVADHAAYLLPYLEDDSDIIKIAAAKTMAVLGDERAVPALNRLTRERNKDLVEAASMAISTIKGDK